MSPLRNLIIYLLAIFAGSAIIAPVIYQFVQFASEYVSLLKPFAGKGFHRYLTRCMLVIAIAGLFPLFRASGVKSLTELGLPSVKQNSRNIV